MKKGFRILAYILLPLFTTVFIVADSIAAKYESLITNALAGNTNSFEGEEADYASMMGDNLVREIEEEGIVLLKNDTLDDNTPSLPLKANLKRVNVFGWGATQFLQKGVGSGSSSINEDKSIDFLKGLEEYGISYNKTLINEYKKFNTTDITVKNNTADYYLYQPTRSWHEKYINEAKEYSDTAILVLHRVGGENIGEIPVSQTLVTESGRTTDSTRTYLQTSKHEDDLITLLGENFANVVLVVNTTNTMHLTCLKSSNIKSCIYVGITGQSGAASIPAILWGKKTVNNQTVLVSPSGKVSDLYSYEPGTSPSYANYKHNSNHIQYVEDIYYGYKWYETADVEGYWDNINNAYGTGYDGVVQFPFGFGMSYSSFSWKNMTTTLEPAGEITKDTKVNVSVTVKNEGNYPAKDVVELYVSPSYQSGGIEKPSIQLVDFAKTKTLNAGAEETLHLSFDLYDIASYDCYDKNNNGFKGYEVDYGSNGEYVIKLMTDSHHEKEMSGANSHTLNIPTAGIRFENDNVTGNEVSNRMTGSNAYANVPIDGSTVNAETTYLSRSNFASTFPNAHAKTPSGTGDAEKYECDYYQTTVNPNQNPTDNGLRIVTLEDGSFATLEELSGKTDAKLSANESLIAELNDYNSDTWDRLLDQMSVQDICDLVENGCFHTYPIDTIGKPRAYDTDGPAGFNKNSQSIGDGDPTKWTAYPSETLIACTWNKELCEKMGLCMGMEGQATKVQGWYAPGVNLHRTPYTARNYEYYSEDAVLSGVMAAKVILGAKTNGLYCYLKHFVLSEPGPNPRKLNTWVTEQNLRENYLKPFEIAVKEGGANAIMSAFNRVGSVWAGASYPCLIQILRNEWGFKGSVITDYVMDTSTSLGDMNPTQGVLAGNSLWLNATDGSITNALSRSNPTVVNAARHAAKDIIYTYINTYYFGTHATTPYDGYKAVVSIGVLPPPEATWIIWVAVIESVIGVLVCTYFAFALASSISIYRRNRGVISKEKVVREPKVIYVTKRMKKLIIMGMALGGVTALLLVTLLPLFTQILVNHTGTTTVIPIDTGDVYANTFEFEEGDVEGITKGEDHLCYASSYFYNMDLSNAGALTKMNEESKITFKFTSKKSYRISMNIRMASIYDETTSTWIEGNLKDYLSLTVNNTPVDLNGIKIPASNELGVLDNYDGKDMNMVNVIGIPVSLSNVSNVYTFTLKDNCPALDSFTLYTSTEIYDVIKGEQINDVKKLVRVSEVPSETSEGKAKISCSHEGCDKESTYNMPILTGKSYYTYDEFKNSYTFDIFGRYFVITPDTADSPIGPIHSEWKEVNNFVGKNFFKASNWTYRSKNGQNEDDYLRSVSDIIDGEGNVVISSSKYAKTRIFYCDKQERKPLVDYSTAQGKDYLGKKIEYSFLVNATGGFTMNAFGTVYSNAALALDNSVPGVFFDFDDEGNVGLTIGVDVGSSEPGKTNKANLKTPKNIVTAPSTFEFNEDTWIKFEFTRHSPERFELAFYVNDQKVMFPTMPSSSTGNLEYRYTENGNIYIIQTSTISHTWGEFISIAPNSNKIFTFKDVNYMVN